MDEEYYIDKLVNFLSPENWTSTARRKLKMFDGAIPYFGPFVKLHEILTPGVPGVWADQEVDCAGRLPNFVFMGQYNGNSSKRNIEQFAFSKVNFQGKRNLVIHRGQTDLSNGTIRIYKQIGSFKDGKARLLKSDRFTRKIVFSGMPNRTLINDWQTQEHEFHQFARMAPGFYFNLYHSWSVYFSTTASISIRFPVDANVALELFRDREKERGELRRKALLHWVRKHMRNRPHKHDKSVSVRKHIRGKTKFFWHGFDCAIEPDQDYLDGLIR